MRIRGLTRNYDHSIVDTQTQLLELKTSNYNLVESNGRKDAQITVLQSRAEELEKELGKMQTLAKMNPLSYAKSMANRKDAREKESLNQLRVELDQLNLKMESQEEEFRRTNDFLKQEINDLLADNQKLRDFVEEVDGGPQFLKSLLNEASDPSSSGPPSPSKGKAAAVTQDEFDIGRTSSFGQASQFTLIAEREKLNNQLLDLQHEMKKVTSERDSLQERLTQVSADHQSLKVKASESSELAEDRKVTIDEMKIHIEESRIQYESEVSDLKQRHEIELQQLQQQLSTFSSMGEELSEKRDKLTESEERRSCLETELMQMSRQLDQVREELVMQKQYYETRMSDLSQDHEARILLLQETQASEVQELGDKLARAEEEITRLNQQSLDHMEDRKIHEKKAVMLMKELKKNLASEKSRAQRLQQKLQDFLSQTASFDPTTGTSASEHSAAGDVAAAMTGAGASGGHLLLSSPSTPLKSPDGKSNEKLNDTSSVGSWSFMSNSRNGNGNGDRMATASNHSNGSNDFATVTATTAFASPDLQPQQQQMHLSSPSSSSSRTDVMIARNSGQQHQQAEQQEAGGGGGGNGTESNAQLLLIEELECENRQLVSRMSDLKQENWQLEERVNQLLSQVDQLTIDNSNKGLIIEFYCMGEQRSHHHQQSAGTHSSNSPSSASGHNHHHHHPNHSVLQSREKMTVRKVVDFIKDRGDENLKEINRKLQRMLEETLTKNMFLQKDLEHLSNEVVRLSKESVPTSTS